MLVQCRKAGEAASLLIVQPTTLTAASRPLSC